MRRSVIQGSASPAWINTNARVTVHTWTLVAWVRAQVRGCRGEFSIDHSWEWKAQRVAWLWAMHSYLPWVRVWVRVGLASRKESVGTWPTTRLDPLVIFLVPSSNPSSLREYFGLLNIMDLFNLSFMYETKNKSLKICQGSKATLNQKSRTIKLDALGVN